MNYPNLKTVTIKGVLSKISNSAFEGCKQIKSITATGAVNAAGKKVLQLGECAFKDCTGLESVEFTGSLAVSKNAFEGCTNLGSVKVKESDMALLGNYAFLNCTKLTEADIPGKLLIQEGAFFECTSLKKFDFSNVSSIGKIAFYHCSSLESIVLPENVTAIGNSAFQGCNGVTSLNIPGTVKSIGEEAFCSCEKLKELVVNEGVSSIGKQAFAGCKSLETITLPKSAALGENIFTDYRPIKTIRYTGTREEWVAAGLNQNNFYNATVYYEYTADHKHTFVTYTYTYTNSCTEPGERVTKCKDCGYIQSKETLPAQGHDWEVVSEKKATCKEEGLQNLKCRRCGETKKVVRIGAHQFSSWQTTKDATVFAPAVQIRTCNVCGYKETRNNGKKLTATMKVNAVKLPLKIKQKTTVLKVSGLANGDSVASWKSGNTKVVKVSGKPNGTCTLAAGHKKGKTTITIILKSGLKKKITITDQGIIHLQNSAKLIPHIIEECADCGKPNGFDVAIMEDQCPKYIIPGLVGCDFTIPARGRSMINKNIPEKSIKDGDIIGCRKWNSRSHIRWGEVYVLSTTAGITVKQILPSEREGYIKCVPFNTEEGFMPFEIPVNEIYDWAIVVGIVSLSMWS